MPMRSAERGTLGGNMRVEQVLESATRLFTEKGYDAASVRDLAAELEIRPSSLYHHFPGKQHILFAICLGLQRDFNDAVLPVLLAGDPPDRTVSTAVRRHVIFNQQRKGEVLVVIRERRSLPADQLAQVNALRRQYRDALAAVIDAGRRQGVFRVPEAKLAAMAIVDMVNGITHWFQPRDQEDLELIADRYAHAAMALLRDWDADGAGNGQVS
jgi:AcrR family transcriptional regulator